MALTVRYADAPGTHESEWQDLVVGHLGIPHEIIQVKQGADEIAGPLGVSQLRRFGALIPPTTGVALGRIASAVAGRTVLTGEGGDEILGEARISIYVAHWRRRLRPNPTAARAMATRWLPRPMRHVATTQRLRRREVAGWMQPDAAREVRRRLVNQLTDWSWDWREERRRAQASRQWWLGSHSLDRVAAAHGFELQHPLMNPGFIDALCQRGGRLGLTTRTEAMRLLAEDLLPLKVLRRRTKAYFNDVYAGDRVRSFATTWDGTGVDRDLVDVDRLRAAWLSTAIPVASLTPLQLALEATAAQGWSPPVDARRLG